MQSLPALLRTVALCTAAVILGVPEAYPCKCPVSTSCPSLPTPGSPDDAVFVGTVIRTAGESFRSRLQKRGWLKEGKRISNKDWAAFVEEYKRSLLASWDGYMSESEAKQIRSAHEPNDFPDDLVEHRRVLLRVDEAFHGARGTEFELITGFGDGDCGVDFEDGGTFLVFAWRHQDNGRWQTSTCSRTRRVEHDDSDVRTLRDLKSGRDFAPRVYGQVYFADFPEPDRPSSPSVKGLTVELSGDGKVVATTQTDHRGRFLFDGLERRNYRVTVRLPGFSATLWNARESEIDLASSGCRRLLLSIRKDAAGANPKR